MANFCTISRAKPKAGYAATALEKLKTLSEFSKANGSMSNVNGSYQVTFSDNNGTGYQRQYIDTDNGHFIYNPSTYSLSGLNLWLSFQLYISGQNYSLVCKNEFPNFYDLFPK